MNINQLNYFIKVADVGSMSKAADELFISHQCLSTTIRNFEKEMGKKLFERSSQGVVLNPDGDIVYQMAKRVLKIVNDAKLELNMQNEYERIKIYILISVGTNSIFFRKIVNQFKAEYPQIELVVQERTSFEALEAVKDGHADMVFVGMPLTFDINSLHENVMALSYYAETMYILVQKNHPLSNYKTVVLEQVVQYPLVIHQRGGNDQNSPIVDRIRELNVRANIALITDSIDMQVEAVENGIGISFVSNAIVNSKRFKSDFERKGLCMVKLEKYAPYIWCIANKSSYEIKKIFLDIFENQFSRYMEV